jgi:hypothetical protein
MGWNALDAGLNAHDTSRAAFFAANFELGILYGTG